MVPFWKSVVMLVTIEVAEPDGGEVNHLLKAHLPNHKHFSLSYTGKAALGKEGETVRVRLEGVECDAGFGVTEHPTLGPMGYDAWICNVEKAKRLP